MRVVCSLILFSLFAACSTRMDTQRSANVGSYFSANNSGKMIGGPSGLIAGGPIGATLDQQDRKVLEKSSPKTVDRMDRGEPLTVNDIIKLHASGVHDEIIIQYIHDTRTSYSLSQSQIRRLQNVGVSQRVINYMIDTGR